MFGSQPLLSNKSTFASHQKLEEIIKKLILDAMQVRTLENELYQLGKKIHATLDNIKKSNVYKVLDLKANYESYHVKLNLYLKTRLDIIKQLPGVIAFIQKDTFEAGNLREADHIKIIDKNYAWLNSDLNTVIQTCRPLCQKDRSSSGSIFRNQEPISALTNDLRSMEQKEDQLPSAKWLETSTGLCFSVPSHTQSNSKESKTISQPSTAAKLYQEFESHLSKVNAQLTQATTSMERLTTLHFTNISNGLAC